MSLVVGVRCSFRGKDAGSADSGCDRCGLRTRPRGEQRGPAAQPIFRQTLLVRQDVPQAHEGDQPDQLPRRMAQPNLAAAALRSELEPCKSVDGHRVGLDAAHVADGDTGLVPFQQCADTPAEPGQVGAGDGTRDRKDDRRS
jgi:hypothetical protein